MSEDLLLAHVIASPKLSLYAARIQGVLQAEYKKRVQCYETISVDEKVECINGDIIYHSPMKFQHDVVQKLLLKILDTHVQLHGIGLVGHAKLLIALSRDDYEPEVCFFAREKAGSFTPRQDRFPAPNFIAKVVGKHMVSCRLIHTGGSHESTCWKDHAAVVPYSTRAGASRIPHDDASLPGLAALGDVPALCGNRAFPRQPRPDHRGADDGSPGHHVPA